MNWKEGVFFVGVVRFEALPQFGHFGTSVCLLPERASLSTRARARLSQSILDREADFELPSSSSLLCFLVLLSFSSSLLHALSCSPRF